MMSSDKHKQPRRKASPPERAPRIELNERFVEALELLEESGKNVFITGRAGTGKSTLLSYFQDTTSKTIAVLAPTGVAALNVRGQTIHSFFGFKPNITLEKIRRLRSNDVRRKVYTKLNTIVIDEISMVRADLLDCVDKFLRLNGPDRKKSFGGIQMIFFGDLYQLPPVVTGTEREVLKELYETPYFYSSTAFKLLDMEFIELEKVYRQREGSFLELLNTIRNNTIDEDGISRLNQRYDVDFEPSTKELYIYMTTTNKLAGSINGQRLAELKGDKYTFTARVDGEFDDNYLPTAMTLELKVGAQIMMVNNDMEGRWVNGSIGRITGITADAQGDAVLIARLADGSKVDISRYTWELFKFYVEDGLLQSKTIGTFTQYPLMLAWAITIHKSQGKTFDRVIIDVGRGAFSSGQVYVALSRCTTLDGIVLRKLLQKKHIWTDYRVVDFLTRFQYDRAELSCPFETKISLIEKAIKEGTALRITYLKPNDEKSYRTILPKTVGDMKYQGKTFRGMRAYCLERKADRTFRIDRILAIEETASH